MNRDREGATARREHRAPLLNRDREGATAAVTNPMSVVLGGNTGFIESPPSEERLAVCH